MLVYSVIFWTSIVACNSVRMDVEMVSAEMEELEDDNSTNDALTTSPAPTLATQLKELKLKLCVGTHVKECVERPFEVPQCKPCSTCYGSHKGVYYQCAQAKKGTSCEIKYKRFFLRSYADERTRCVPKVLKCTYVCSRNSDDPKIAERQLRENVTIAIVMPEKNKNINSPGKSSFEVCKTRAVRDCNGRFQGSFKDLIKIRIDEIVEFFLRNATETLKFIEPESPSVEGFLTRTIDVGKSCRESATEEECMKYT